MSNHDTSPPPPFSRPSSDTYNTEVDVRNFIGIGNNNSIVNSRSSSILVGNHNEISNKYNCHIIGNNINQYGTSWNLQDDTFNVACLNGIKSLGDVAAFQASSNPVLLSEIAKQVEDLSTQASQGGGYKAKASFRGDSSNDNGPDYATNYDNEASDYSHFYLPDEDIYVKEGISDVQRIAVGEFRIYFNEFIQNPVVSLAVQDTHPGHTAYPLSVMMTALPTEADNYIDIIVGVNPPSISDRSDWGDAGNPGDDFSTKFNPEDHPSVTTDYHFSLDCVQFGLVGDSPPTHRFAMRRNPKQVHIVVF